jgi:hypothetical protein
VTLLKRTFAAKEIEIVSSLNYFGVVFSSGGCYNNATNILAVKRIKARNKYSSCMNVPEHIVPVNLMFNLFDAYVLTVVNYGCKFWGFLKVEI